MTPLGQKGLDPDVRYEATVVHNDDTAAGDGRQLGRIQARVNVHFDGIPDEDLPWAMPNWEHVDGASAESGVFTVPKVGSKVLIEFQKGKAENPIYHGYTGDSTTQLVEKNANYPNRAVLRFKNGACVVIDTSTNEVYVQVPGKMKVVIGEDLDLTVLGNMTTRVMGKRTDVTNEEHLVKSKEKKEFVTNDATTSVGGDARYSSKGETTVDSKGDLGLFGAMVNVTAEAVATISGKGGGVDLDPSPGSGPSAPSAPSSSTVAADSFVGMPRGVQPSSWSDGT